MSLNLIERAASVHRWMLVGYIVALLLTVAFTYLLWSSGNREQEAIRADADNRLESVRLDGQTAARESSEKIAGLNAEAEKLRLETETARREISSAKSDAAKANERAGALELETAKQREKAANAERELLALQRRIAPRQFSAGEMASLIEELRRSPVKGLVEIGSVIGDSEGDALATQFDQALKAGGWTTHVYRSAYVGGDPIGLGFVVHSISATPPTHLLALSRALATVGVILPTIEDAGLADGALKLLVGIKPR